MPTATFHLKGHWCFLITVRGDNLFILSSLWVKLQPRFQRLLLLLSTISLILALFLDRFKLRCLEGFLPDYPQAS